MIDGAPSCGGQAASYGGGLRSNRLNEIIRTYLGNLSIRNYKWLRCYGIEESKVETRNVKVETGRAERVNPAPFGKPTPKGCATQEHLSVLRVVHPAYSFAPTGNARFLSAFLKLPFPL